MYDSEGKKYLDFAAGIAVNSLGYHYPGYDEALKEQIRQQYPEMWQRMQVRRQYIVEQLGIQLSEDVLPMCSTVAYLRPYLLSKDLAFVSR